MISFFLFKKSINHLSIFKFKSSPISKKKKFVFFKILFADAIKLVEHNKTSVSLLASNTS